MLVFGIDVPLVEVLFASLLVTIVILLECIVIIILLMRESSRTTKLTTLTESLSRSLLEHKKHRK